MTTNKTLEVLLKVARTLTSRDLSIETWSPGDGWTRYRISENHESMNVSHYLTKGECETWLRAFIEGAESALGRDRVNAIFAEQGNPWNAAA